MSLDTYPHYKLLRTSWLDEAFGDSGDETKPRRRPPPVWRVDALIRYSFIASPYLSLLNSNPQRVNRGFLGIQRGVVEMS